MAEFAPKVYDFRSFVDEFPLPQVVKVIDEVYDNEDQLTLPAHEVIHLHLIKNCETVKATDERNREYCLPLNSPSKVKVLPNPVYQESYVDVRKLAEDLPPFVQVCDDYTELNIERGDVLRLKEVFTNPQEEDYLKCECTNKEKPDIWIPFSYQVKFKTLGDFGHSVLFLKEVVAKTSHFPVLVKFQGNFLKARRSDINAGCPTGFDQLGTLTLKEVFVMKLVVATSCSAEHGRGRTLLTIPIDLKVRVIPVLDKSERSAYQAGKHHENGSLKIDFNETSFRYGCNVIEKQGNVLSKQRNSRKPIPRPRSRVTLGVTPGVTLGVTSMSSSHIRDNEQAVNNSRDVSWPNDETEEEMTRAGDIERRLGGTSLSNENEEEIYVDMSGATSCIPQFHIKTSHDIKDKTNDCEIPVIHISENQVESSPRSIVEKPGDDNDDDVFQGGHGHLGLPPPFPRRFDNEREEEEEQYVCMSGEVAEGDTRDHLEDHHSKKKASRTLSDQSGYRSSSRFSTSSDSSSTSSPTYHDVPHSTSQTKSKKTKSKIRRKIHELTKMLPSSAFKRSKSATDMPSEDYHYVQSLPEAQADKQTEIGKFLSYFQKSKKPNKRGKDLSPKDYLSTLSIDEVSESLKSLNLHRYVETFRANTIDGNLLMDLNDKMLDELEVTSELDRLKIRKLQKEGWTPKYY